MRLYVIGLGPGEQSQITPKAMAAIADSDVIAGYTVYVDLIKHLTVEKEILTTPMKQEIDRCRMAIEEAVKGKTVSMVCSGDAGVYGMAGLIYELSIDYPPIEIEVIPELQPLAVERQFLVHRLSMTLQLSLSATCLPLWS